MSESIQPAPAFNPTLTQGLDTLSGNQAVPFTQYVRHVLPLDGYVFWLATQQTMITGSLHVAANSLQNEDGSPTINSVMFTTSEEIASLNDIAPNTIWVGQWDDLKFAFSRRGPFYENAGLYHYAGDAVYPEMESQLIDVGSELSVDTLIVSNSLPAWLALRSYKPIWLTPCNPEITLYPSFAVPDNLRPPYGSVHIEPTLTRPLQGAPVLTRHASHWQLSADHVRVTLYGLTNLQAQDWLDTLFRYSYDTNIIGLMTPAVLRDEKRTQNELNILAMKKTIEFDWSYNQTAVRHIARQMLEKAAATIITQCGVP